MIYLAKITVDIRRYLRKDKFDRQKLNLEMVYKLGSEKNKKSYFISCIEKEINIRFDKKEDYKILSIETIKPLGLCQTE